jgi:NAD(P)H dehydrogenase (quinone)
MKHILIIVAHPKQEGFSFAMANTYKTLSEKKGDKVELIDLYRTKYQQPFFTYNDANDAPKTEAITYFQEKMANADEIVFIFPYWWGSFPAILKNFMDTNLTKGFAFEYVNSRPKGLLQGKEVKVFTTTGAPKFIYTLTGANRRLKNTLKAQVIEFCGMKLTSFDIFGGVDTNRSNTEKILAQITAKHK